MYCFSVYLQKKSPNQPKYQNIFWLLSLQILSNIDKPDMDEEMGLNKQKKKQKKESYMKTLPIKTPSAKKQVKVYELVL